MINIAIDAFICIHTLRFEELWNVQFLFFVTSKHLVDWVKGVGHNKNRWINIIESESRQSHIWNIIRQKTQQNKQKKQKKKNKKLFKEG